MRLREGDELQCQCGDCFVNLKVTKSCTDEECGHECDVELRCCGREMKMHRPDER